MLASLLLRWAERGARGRLVWSPMPVAGPLPNFGNGYIASQWRQSGGSMFIAGVMSSGLPPPFDNATGGGVSQRTAVPL